MALTKLKSKNLLMNMQKQKNKKIPNSWKEKKIADEDWLKDFRKRMGDLSLRKSENTVQALPEPWHSILSMFMLFLTTSKVFLSIQTSLQPEFGILMRLELTQFPIPEIFYVEPVPSKLAK